MIETRSSSAFRIAALCLLVTFMPAPIAAQTAQRSAIVGRVYDRTGAVLSGAAVVLGGPSVLGGERRTETDATGRFRFGELLPGTYSVSAQAPRLQRTAYRSIELPVETTWTIAFTLDVERRAEHVEVPAEPPLVDVTSSGSAAHFSRTLLQSLPAGRSLEAVLNLAPGVTDNVALGGAQHSSNGFSLDRVSLADPYLGGAFVPISYNSLESVQVIGVGAPAEYGQFTGALVNGVVRSGGNRFAGLGEYVAAVPGWTGHNTKRLSEARQQQFAPRDLEIWWDANAQMGGPVRQDRLWYFAAVHRIRERFRPFWYDGPERASRIEPGGIVKMDGAPRRDVNLQGFYQRDVADSQGVNLSPFTPTLQTTGIIRRRNHVWNARATWTIGAAIVVEARTGGYSGVSRRDPVPPATTDHPAVRRDMSTGVFADNVLNVSRDERAAVTSGLRVTHRRRSLGWHELTFGMEHEATHADSFVSFGGNRIEEQIDGVTSSMTMWDGNHTQTANRRTTVYVQDRWMVFDRVTLEPGLRLEMYRGRVQGQEPVFATNPIAPRLGVAWDLRGTHRTVARAHYGRYHDMAFSYIYSWHDVDGFSPRITLNQVASGEFVEVGRFIDAIHAAPIDRALKQSHVDQWTAGIEHQLPHGVAVEGRHVHRRFGNFIGYLDRRLDEWTPFSGLDPGPDGQPGTADDGGLLYGYVPYPGERDLVITNPDGAFRQYDALQAIARRRHAQGWEAQASYTWSRSVGTVAGLQGSNATFWGLSPLGYGGAPGGSTSLRDAGKVRSQFDYSELKLLGWYRADWLRGITTGAVYRWHTGSRWHRLTSIGVPPLTAFVPAEAPNSRRTPPIGMLDLRVEKTFGLRSPGETLRVYVDALNATNTGRALAYVRGSGPFFGQPQRWTDPRTMRVGVRYGF